MKKIIVFSLIFTLSFGNLIAEDLNTTVSSEDLNITTSADSNITIPTQEIEEYVSPTAVDNHDEGYDPAIQEANPLMFDDNVSYVDPNGNIQENNATALIGDDLMVKKDIDSGLTVLNDLGDKNIHVMIDESGNRILVDENGTRYVDKKKDKDLFNELQQDYLNREDNVSTKEGLIIQNEKDFILKKRQLNNVNKNADSVNDMKSRYLSRVSVVGSGESDTSIFMTDINNLKAKKANGEELTDEELNELNTTLFYKKNFTLYPDYDTKKSLIQENTTALSNAYKDLEVIKEGLTARLRAGKIQCQITRNLVPSYYCPIQGKEGIHFPASSIDAIKVDMDQVYKECTDFCVSDPGDYPVVAEKIMPDNNVTINFNETEIFPEYNSENMDINITTNGIMPLKFIKFQFKIPKPENISSEDWQKYIDKYKPRVKFDLLYYTKNQEGTVAVNTLYRHMILHLYSEVTDFMFPINVIGVKYKIHILKPYFEHTGEDKIFEDLGGKIYLSSVKTEYLSDSFYYCSISQTVALKNDCYNPDLNVKEFNYQGQDIFVCRDLTHKVGPEPIWGAYYSEDNARKNCIIRKNCKPTYISLNGEVDNAVLYKSTINCVDSPDNTACSDSLCEELFKDQNKTILNEYYVGLDKKDKVNHRYTIRNNALTGLIRPKINFNEFSDVSDYQKLFQTEEKDSAYMSMINNLTFNRDHYRVGTESPAQTYYKLLGTTNDPKLNVVLKPASFDYGEGEYYLYSVMVMDHFFEPLYGTWTIDDNKIYVSDGDMVTNNGLTIDQYNSLLYSNNPNVPLPSGGSNLVYNDITGKWEFPQIRFMDKTYLIKTGEEDADWKVFRVIKNDKFESTHSKYVMDDNSNVTISTRRDWVDIPAYKKDEIKLYNPDSGKLEAYDYKTEEAPYYDIVSFDIDKDYFEYTITNNISRSYLLAPGGLIRDQEGVNHNTSFKRLYNVPFSNKRHDSYIRNVKFYLVYSDHKLTYEDILKEIEGENWSEDPIKAFDNKWGVYEKVNSIKYLHNIRGDEEINNGIMLFKKGKPENLTLGVHWGPSLTTKGQKAYKFVFLYDDLNLNDEE